MYFIRAASDYELWASYRSLPSYLKEMAGHHSNRDTSWVEAGGDLGRYGLAHSDNNLGA